jgi:3-hydroxyacyl-[acyl-carrier-protein] dehydratase
MKLSLKTSGLKMELGIIDILKCQKNRHPILFIDKCINVVPGDTVTSLKAFSYNEWYFPAHYEDEPSVPGFILIESLVQSFIMTFLTLEKYKGSKTNFLNVDNVKFRRGVVPGDTLIIESKLQKLKRGIASGSSIASIGNEFCCSADFVVSIRNETDEIFKKLQELTKNES